jgi:hypothetical protein
MVPGWKPGQVIPVNAVDEVSVSGDSSGLPQAQRTRGSPWESMSTAVPAWSTDWKLVALPLAKPWLVTWVSRLSTTAVSDPMYDWMSDCGTPSTPAQALALAGLAARKADSWATSQLESCSVPP